MSETNGELLGYIPDGHTDHGFVKGIPGKYPSVTFRYRPMQPKPRQRLLSQLGNLLKSGAVDRIMDVYASLIKRHIIEWDLKKNAREIVPRENDEILRLQPDLFDLFTEIILGREACDPPPADMMDPNNEGTHDPDAILDSCEEGETLEENLVKN